MFTWPIFGGINTDIPPRRYAPDYNYPFWVNTDVAVFPIVGYLDFDLFSISGLSCGQLLFLPSPPLSEWRYYVARCHAVLLCVCLLSHLYHVSTARCNAALVSAAKVMCSLKRAKVLCRSASCCHAVCVCVCQAACVTYRMQATLVSAVKVMCSLVSSMLWRVWLSVFLSVLHNLHWFH